MDRHNEATKRFPQFCKLAQKIHTFITCRGIEIVNIFERQGGHHEVLDNIKIKHVSTTRYILSPRHQIRQHVSAIL